MKPGFGALIVVDMDGNGSGQFELLARRQLIALQVGPDDVVGFAGRDALGKLSGVIGVDFPADLLFFVVGAADLHGDAVEGVTVGSPYGSEDHGVRLGSCGWGAGLRTRKGRHKRKKQGRQRQGEELATAEVPAREARMLTEVG
jgi:hypothetical protein